MRWLVMRVVDKQAATDIVEKLRRDGQPVPDVRAVEIALERASALIGLPLPEVRGAPRATAARTMRSR